MEVWTTLTARLATFGLSIMGVVRPIPDDNLGEAHSLALVGPAGPEFWSAFCRSPEAADAVCDPIDRWSLRVLSQIADEFGAEALFPFGPPPYVPFYQWALRSGRCWPSPVSLLVHDRAGLFVSFRGALALPFIAPASSHDNPCLTCDGQPCLTACPAEVLGAQGYDINGCHRFLDTDPGALCLDQGCQVRRACPVGATQTQPPAQSALHMRSFHPS